LSKEDFEERLKELTKPVKVEWERRLEEVTGPQVDEVERVRRELKEKYGVEQPPLPEINPEVEEEEYERVRERARLARAERLI